MSEIKLITGLWNLKDAYFPKNRGKVFSCFACCGGSTMGYKLAGFDVVGCNEIDPKVFEIYKANHNPKYAYVMSIRDMLKKEDLPDELYNLDILDGSPPCTSFSTAGVRERDWGKEKKFSEGQALQRLDDLFFEFIALAERLKPKIVVAENVSGMLKGKAKGYIKEIVREYDRAGYNTQLFRLNGANMGLPQARDRVFFVSYRKDLEFPKLRLSFNEKPILLGSVLELAKTVKKNDSDIAISNCYLPYWKKCKQGQKLSEHHPNNSFFTKHRLSVKKVCPSLTTNPTDPMHPFEPRYLSVNEWKIICSFPIDMDWLNNHQNKKRWAMGMSVPPFMMQRIADQIYKQWLK